MLAFAKRTARKERNFEIISFAISCLTSCPYAIFNRKQTSISTLFGDFLAQHFLLTFMKVKVAIFCKAQEAFSEAEETDARGCWKSI